MYDNRAQLKNSCPIQLEPAIPYRNRIKTPNNDFQRLITQCDNVRILLEKYSPSCFMARNRFMVDASQRVIAVYDGRGKGGTFATLCYARSLEKNIRLISV